MDTTSRIFSLLWIIAYLVMISCRVEFTNIKCVAIDKEFNEFEKCVVKSVNRSYSYFSMKAKLYQVPVNNALIRVALFKRMNGYKPFLYDITFDACKFLKRPTNAVVKYFYGFIKTYSNMNHTCPYDHDIMIEKVPISFFSQRVTGKLPFSEGDYAVHTTWINYGIARANLSLYLSIF